MNNNIRDKKTGRFLSDHPLLVRRGSDGRFTTKQKLMDENNRLYDEVMCNLEILRCMFTPKKYR